MTRAPQGSHLAIGVDLVDVPRFAEFLRRNRLDLGEVFTRRELAAADIARRDLYLASRWGLKEAVLKALGTGWGSGVQFTDVEALGGISAPLISLHGKAQQLADEAGNPSVTGSTGCAGDSVIAIVVLSPAAAGT